MGALAGTGRVTCRFLSWLILLIYGFSFIPAPGSVFSSPLMAIAVLDFEGTGAEAKYQTLSKAIPESISSFLIKYAQGKLIIVERQQVEKAIKELGFQKSGFTDEESALQVGKLTNATHVLVGSYSVIDNVLRINARLIDVQTGQGVLAESVTGKGGKKSFNQINLISGKIIENLTGTKVKIQDFKDVKDPISSVLGITKKKSNWLWIALGVAAVAAVVIASQNDTEVAQTVNVSP